MTRKEINKLYPLCGHWTDHIVIDRRGALYTTFHLAGLASEMADVGTIRAAKLSMNQLVKGCSDPRITFWDHFTRIDGQSTTVHPEPDNWFAARYDAAIRESQGRDLYRNDLFFTIAMEPHDSLLDGFMELMGARGTDFPHATDRFAREFEMLSTKIERGLHRYGPRRLGRSPCGRFSEVFEAYHLVANNRVRSIGLAKRGMGRLVLPNRVVFDARGTGYIAIENDPRYFAILSLLEYPTGGYDREKERFIGGTSPVMFDALKSARFGLTIANSFNPSRKFKALRKIQNREGQLKSGEDPGANQLSGANQLRALAEDEAEVMDGHSSHGSHHFSVAVFARSIEQLNMNVAEAETMLSDAGLSVIRETEGLKPTFFSQIPSNGQWHGRRAAIKSVNAVSMASKHNVPEGRPRSRWGAPITTLRTTSDTAYDFHLHVQGSEQLPKEDMANVLIIGPGGSGKTVLLGSIAILALRNPTTRVVVVDKDFGLAPAIRAAGGNYSTMTYGESTGISLLQGLTDSVSDRAYAIGDIRAKILSDERGPITSDEDERLTIAVNGQMKMPPRERSLGGVAVMLGQRKRADGVESAGSRLRVWCRGERLGWVSDNEKDTFDLSSSRISGFDTKDLFKDPLVCSAVLSNLFYRISKLINGQPILLIMDEMWRLDKIEAYRERNQDDLKTIRKNEGGVVLATQNAADIADSPYAHTFVQQIQTKIFFGDVSQATIKGQNTLMGDMGLTRAEYLAVTDKLPNMRHTFLIKRPCGSVLCSLDLSDLPGKVAVISGRRSTYDLMNRLIAKHGSDPKAWVPHFEEQAPLIVDNPMLAPIAA